MSVVVIAVVLVLGILVPVHVIVAGPLWNVLVELCGTETRAHFWRLVSETALTCGVLLSAALSLTIALSSGTTVAALAWSLRGVTAGALVGLSALGAVVAGFSRQVSPDA